MRPSIVWTILVKELRETLRDRRTLLLMIGLPVLLYPLLLLGMASVGSAQREARRTRTSTVAIWGTLPPDLHEALATLEHVRVQDWAGAPPGLRDDQQSGGLDALIGRETPPDDGRLADKQRRLRDLVRAVIGRGLADVVLVPRSDLTTAIEQGRAGLLDIHSDGVDGDSAQALERIEATLSDYRRGLVKRRERDRGLPDGFTRGLDVWTTDVAPPARSSGQHLGMLLPFVMILMALLGGFYPSIDLTAGEKERGTMQTLLCAPLRPTEIIAGKFCAVMAISLTAGLANLLSLAAATGRAFASAELPFSVSWGTLAVTFALFVPVSLITSAVFLAIGVFARDFKDGQNLITPVYLLLAAPLGITALPDVALGPATAFAPILNLALLMKAVLIGEVDASLVFATLLSTAIYALLALRLAARVFAREQVLLGGKEPLRQTLGLVRQPGQLPGPAFALSWFGVAVVVLFYGSLLVEGTSVVRALLVVQLGLILPAGLLPVIAIGFRPRATLALRRPPPQGLAAAALIGLSGWTLALAMSRLLPAPEGALEGMRALLLLERPLLEVLLLLALLPAVCEELLFRGLLLTGLRSLGAAAAIGLSALLFGLFHGSLYRLLPTAALGLCLGLLVWRSGSILCGMLAHALHNGLLVSAARAEARGAPWVPAGELPWIWLALGGLVLALGVTLAARLAPPERS